MQSHPHLARIELTDRGDVLGNTGVDYMHYMCLADSVLAGCPREPNGIHGSIVHRTSHPGKPRPTRCVQSELHQDPQLTGKPRDLTKTGCGIGVQVGQSRVSNARRFQIGSVPTASAAPPGNRPAGRLR